MGSAPIGFEFYLRGGDLTHPLTTAVVGWAGEEKVSEECAGFELAHTDKTSMNLTRNK